ncbi:unnamed protein product [Ceratitis capitata]|uniref:(Mediterranean fruit fly) hypothetical protein n=1 Tax=Ceratitis capitata TaxID=7213 RepID=A0A811U2M6_CERCA|nr:unnamed protein product [Ceratitis capitata]
MAGGGRTAGKYGYSESGYYNIIYGVVYHVAVASGVYLDVIILSQSSGSDRRLPLQSKNSLALKGQAPRLGTEEKIGVICNDCLA